MKKIKFLALLTCADALAPRRRVAIFETTLRDGEQGCKRLFTPVDKASIASRLESDVGVDVIDAGMLGTQTWVAVCWF